MNWLNSLKVALLNNDEVAAFALIENLPETLANESLETQLQALELISQVKTLLESKQFQTRVYMEQIKAAKKFTIT